jgi:hypothetical protein|nr:MAG TPA: hypothetical protein [Caudoviricetes sp.]
MKNIKFHDADLKYVEAMYLYADASSKLTVDEAGKETVTEEQLKVIERFFLAGKVIIQTTDKKFCRPVAYANKVFTCVVPKASPTAVTDVIKDFTVKTA